jgi:hypothetical protein
MSDSRDQKNRDNKENGLVIDTNAPDCIFKLSHIAALMEAEDGKIQLKEVMFDQSEKFLQMAREGQGFGTIEIIYKDLKKDQWIKEAFLILAFNNGDGLAREDKEGQAYNKLVFVSTAASVGQSGAGQIHVEASKVSLLLKALSKRKDKDKLVQKFTTVDELMEVLTIKNNFRGCIMGGALVKGAESHEEKDYKIHILNSQHAVDINYIRKSFQPVFVEDEEDDVIVEKLKDEFLKKYKMINSKNGHLFLIKNDEHKSYEIYYIRNGKFIRAATKVDISEVPQDRINPFINKIKKKKKFPREKIIQQCLIALKLYNPFTMNNKSNSLNDASIFYDPDFESFVMYLNPERYLLNKKKQIMPEGKEWGSLFDLHRSVPMVLSDAFRDQLLKNFNIQDEKIISKVKKQQQAKCSSWDDNYPYNEVIKNYCLASKDEKLRVYTNNIHITLRLYEKTLLMYKKNEPIWGKQWRPVTVDRYLAELTKRLMQLLISHHKLSEKIDFDSAFELSLFGEDKRNLSQVIKSLEDLFDDEYLLISICREKSDRIKEITWLCHRSLGELRAPYLEAVKEHIQFLCDPQKEARFLRFNMLLRKSHFVCSGEKEIHILLQKLLIEIHVNSISALENAVNKKSYQVAVMVLFYGGINAEILKKVSETLIDHIQKEAIIQRDPLPEDESALILDDFLRSFIRQVHRHGLSLPDKFSKLVIDNSKFLPKAMITIQKLVVKEEPKAEDLAQQPALRVHKKVA